MTFQAMNLSVLAYANHFTLWHYSTADKDITQNGYFKHSATTLRVNDLIIATIDTDGTPACGFYVVSANDESGISVTTYGVNPS